MRFLKIFSAFALLVGLSQAAGAQTCTPKVPASSLIEAPKWQMSINPTLPPQQFVDDKGELQGLNVELAREIAKRICVEPVFLRMDFPPMIPALRSAASMPSTPACSGPRSGPRCSTSCPTRSRRSASTPIPPPA
ncbi:ABC-type amino acid transport substrate-binding protein [Bradyrhizobium diazoefficiens]|nr:transporter substrate-binding domain-containing protein [Bradyrhizobium diazoefficiens]